MAKINVGAWSGPSGKIGNLVAGSWRGITYLRAMPENFIDANTLLQQATRMKMKLIVKFLKSCNPFIRVGYRGYSTPQMAAFHAATSYNYHHGLTGEFPNLAVDYANIMVSPGTLPIANDASCDAPEAGKISFTWTPDSDMKEAKSDDTAMLLVYNPVRNYAVYSLQGNVRIDGFTVLTVPSIFAGEQVHCYLSFVNLASLTSDPSEEFVSDPMYLGQVKVL